jgi:hypothetical protein
VIAPDVVQRLPSVAVVLEDNGREAIDDPQGRAQVVRNRVGEAVKFAHGVVEFPCALGQIAPCVREVILERAHVGRGCDRFRGSRLRNAGKTEQGARR